MKKSKSKVIEIMYVKVTENDNWGNITTFVDKRKKLEFKIPPSGKMHVLFPDGHEELISVEMRTYVTNIQDMGNNYDVSGEVPYAVITYHGQKIGIRLSESKLKVAISTVTGEIL